MVDKSNVTDRRRRPRGLFLASFAIESVAVLVSIFLAIISVGHIAQTDWSQTFLYNGDSLALPLIERSIQNGEPFRWVFSSQNYLFPEGPIFFLSSIFTHAAREAMYINGCLNVVALYALMRAIAHNLSHRSRHRFVEVTIAIAATTLMVIFILLEPTAAVNGKGIATLFLFSTYYDGVILSALAVIALTLWVTRAFGPVRWGRNRIQIYGAAVIAITTLTAFSDPLYLLQLVVPLAGAGIILIFLNRVSWSGFFVLAVPTLVGTLFAIALRAAFSKSFASGIGSYVSFGRIPASLHLLFETLRQLAHSRQGVLSIVLLGGILIVTFALFVFALYAQARPRLAAAISTSEIFMVSFVTVSTVSLICGMVITGSTTTRYLEPIYVFPLLVVVSLGVYILRRLLIGVERVELRRSLSRFAVVVAAVGSAFFIVVGIINIAPVAKSASGSGYTGAACFDRFIGKSTANGVGSYWTVRTLALYGDSKGAVLQADDNFGELQVFPWINNMGTYEGKTFSYVVTDASNQISPSGLTVLGKPRQVVSCPGYLIYDYRGTPGEKILNSKIDASLDRVLARLATQ
jgi:hypothetical protein